MVQVKMVLPVEKLNSENYKLWAFCMEYYLHREGLWVFVNDPLDSPTPAEEERDKCVVAAIVLSLRYDQIVYITSAVSAAEAWVSLQAV